MNNVQVLGCPNLPLAKFGRDDGGPSPEAGYVRDGYGAIFAAIRGQGAFEGALNSTGVPLPGAMAWASGCRTATGPYAVDSIR